MTTFIADLDHTADVQCHCWGKTLADAFANMAPCMFNYMTDLSTVVIDPAKAAEFTVKGNGQDLISNFKQPCFLSKSLRILSSLIVVHHYHITIFSIEGHDMMSLLHKYMEELLFNFSTDNFCCVRVDIINFDRDTFEIKYLT
jgi:SHS2 domain-containing protein